MASNKSSTPKLLPNKLIQALIHAVLEWILIILLLLDSLFFYLIARFANMFGLQPPCRWCSRLDHHTLSVQDKANINSGSYKDICEIHATQISKLAYCSNHSNLAESQNMCMECLSSSSSQVNNDQAKSSSHQSSIITEIAETRSTTRLCSCCGATSVINNMDHPSLPLQLVKGGSETPEEENVIISPGLCLGSASGSGASGRNTESNITSMKQEKGDCCGDINYEERDNELLLSDVSSFLYRSEDTDEEEEQDSSGATTAALLKHDNPGENDSRKISTQEEAVVSITTEDYHAKSRTGNHTNEVIKANKLPSDETPLCRGGLENYAMEMKMAALEDNRILSTEIECCTDHTLTTEQLRSALQAERKARAELYAELEAERSASTIAANQTIAMITRLQEEKATIKMEALQYQRMMEEQSEYDQEALRLLSELVSKREKEKEELEKEVDMFRQRALRYEDKGKAILIQENEDSFGSKDDDSCNEDDSDMVLSIDLNHHGIGENNDDNDLGDGSNQETRSQDISTSTDMVQKSVDMVLEHVKEWRSLDDSLTEFEQERLSIIHQLKELEEKLYILDDGNNKEESDGEVQIFKDVKPVDNSFEDQGSWHSDHEVIDTHLCNAEVNLAGAATMFSADHLMITENQSKTLASAANGLLHLLGPDDSDVVIEREMSSDCSLMEEENSISIIDTGKQKRLAIEKEVDHVYGRLHALEADREFLRQCVTSMTKGNEGIVILQDILRHLREIKTAKICV